MYLKTYGERRINIVKFFCINLNIHYTLPDELWHKIEDIYTQMPGWVGVIEDKDYVIVNPVPRWYGSYGTDDDVNKAIEVSVEPSGLQFFGRMSEKEWENWISLFKKKATEVLGYEVGELEDGYDFVYFNEKLEKISKPPDTK